MNTNSTPGTGARRLLVYPTLDAQALYNSAHFFDRPASGRWHRSGGIEKDEVSPQDRYSGRRPGQVLQGPWLGPVALDPEQGPDPAGPEAPLVVHLACTLMGPQHPDLVDLVTRTLAEAHASVLDTRMTILGGEFAMLVHLAVEGRHHRALEVGLEELSYRFGLRLMVQVTSGPVSRAAGTLLEVEAQGVDREGLVRALTACLTEHGGQVEELEARVPSPQGPAVPLATLRVRVRIRQDAHLEAVEEGLQELAVARNLEVRLRLAPAPGAGQGALAF